MKRKFSLLINIATLALCVCAIAFGVYSAKTASLNVSGTVGFTAHNCKVKVDSSLSGFSETPDGEVVPTARKSTKIVEGTAELDLGTFYFTDLTASGNTNDITLSLKFTNQSDFAVDIAIAVKDLSSSNIQVTSKKQSLTLAEQTAATGKSDTVEVTLRCTPTTKIDSKKFEILSVNMEKYIEVEDDLKGTWVLNSTIDVTNTFSYNVAFMSNNKVYSSFESGGHYHPAFTGTQETEYELLYDEETAYSTDIGDGWMNTEYKTITITSKLSEVTNGEALLAWLQANAKKQGGVNSTPTLISFTIGGTPYQAEEGMTWREWVDSEYNFNFFISNQAIGDGGGDIIDGVAPDDVIVANRTYFKSLAAAN